MVNINFPNHLSAGAVEYTDRISAESQDALHECPRYDTKQSSVEALKNSKFR